MKNVLLPQLKTHVEQWKNCTMCEIGVSARNHVFFRGTLPCDVLFVGEGPGREEDKEGKPFVGRSGKLLDEWIATAFGGVRMTWAITNVVACRPCEHEHAPNRRPRPKEISNCRPRLWEFLQEISGARGLVLLGAVAQEACVSMLPGKRFVDLHHPSYVLRCGGLHSTESKRCIDRLKTFLKELTRAAA